MDFIEVLNHLGGGVIKTPEISKAEFENTISDLDRENLNVIADEIKSSTNQADLGSEMLVVGGSVNHPEKAAHKDLDVKISVRSGHSASPVVQAIKSATKALAEKGVFQVETVHERSPLVEEGFVTTYNLHPKNGGRVIEIIPPYGSEDLPLELEKTVGRSGKRRFYVFSKI